MQCKRVKKNIKWYQRLWNIIIGHKNRNYTYVESREDERKCK